MSTVAESRPGDAVVTQRISCAEATLRTMVETGADTLFNVPGRGVYPLLEELPKFPELAYVTALHEFPLTAMADGYARARGVPAFLNLYMSTGVLNAASAIFLAQRDRVPMVVTATQAESWALGADHRAEISDIVASVRPFTKWAWMPPSPERVPEALRRAHAIATTPPCGPTFVAIPVDYWTAEIDHTAQLRPELPSLALAPSCELVERIASLLLDADFPCVVAGYEALRAGLGGVLRDMTATLGCGLAAEPEPPMLPAPVDFELFAGSVTEATELIEQSDVVLHAGVNTYEAFHGAIFEAGSRKTHVWLGSSEQEMGKVIAADVAAIGPIEPILRALAERVAAGTANGRGPDRVMRRAQVAGLIAAEREPLLRARAEGWDAEPMSVARICSELRALLPPETILVDHSTTAVRLVRENFPLPAGEQYISASGSCQGWGLGAAVGVQLASGDTPVLGIVGDGGFMFGVQAVWSAVQYQLPVLIVILDNGGWSSMRASLTRNAPSVLEAGIDMHFGWSADYAQLARSLGADAVTITTPRELTDVVSARLPLRGPLVLDARCRREHKTSRSPFVGY